MCPGTFCSAKTKEPIALPLELLSALCVHDTRQLKSLLSIASPLREQPILPMSHPAAGKGHRCAHRSRETPSARRRDHGL